MDGTLLPGVDYGQEPPYAAARRLPALIAKKKLKSGGLIVR
jgi:hypothetical protein